MIDEKEDCYKIKLAITVNTFAKYNDSSRVAAKQTNKQTNKQEDSETQKLANI